MNFILDENVSFGLVKKLRSDGHNVISIAENPERGLGDDIIFILCRKTKSIVITRDYHFTNAIRFPTKDAEGIIYIRHGNLTSNEEIELVNQFLNTHPFEWIRGKLVILSKEGIRVR